MAEVVVYSTPLCAPCERLKQYLESKGVSFVAKDLLMDEEAAEKMEDLGIRSAPVLEVDGRCYSGSELTPEFLAQVLGIA
ncbi:MAG: glutaredoxin family protein [Burkholderiales bacterium]|nr:glutaredoxin family protein [Burkholderiales bacterium]